MDLGVEYWREKDDDGSGGDDCDGDADTVGDPNPTLPLNKSRFPSSITQEPISPAIPHRHGIALSGLAECGGGEGKYASSSSASIYVCF